MYTVKIDHEPAREGNCKAEFVLPFLPSTGLVVQWNETVYRPNYGNRCGSVEVSHEVVILDKVYCIVGKRFGDTESYFVCSASDYSRKEVVLEYYLQVRLEKEPEGGFSAIGINLPGCASCGKDRDSAIKNIREAFIGCLLSYHELGETIPWTPVEIDCDARRDGTLWEIVVTLKDLEEASKGSK